MTPNYLHLDPFLSASDADNMLKIAESFGSFGTYANEATSEGLGENLPQRFDAGLNYISGGIDGLGNDDDPVIAASRTNYFRETYAYGDVIHAPGIQAFMEHSALRTTARQIAHCKNIVPAIVYANLLIPGQELAIHTDVPEFRGANRKSTPQWLLVCMLHSGLFDRWRVPILTCVSWFGHARGGAFTFYLEGPGSPRQAISATHNSAILIDTDMVFHGVERVTQTLPDLPAITKNTRLFFCEGERWELREGEEVLGEYRWQDLRYSISWKAYCFKDESDQLAWSEGNDELSLDKILATLEAELRQRSVLSGARPEPTEFAVMLVEHFIKFPSVA